MDEKQAMNYEDCACGASFSNENGEVECPGCRIRRARGGPAARKVRSRKVEEMRNPAARLMAELQAMDPQATDEHVAEAIGAVHVLPSTTAPEGLAKLAAQGVTVVARDAPNMDDWHESLAMIVELRDTVEGMVHPRDEPPAVMRRASQFLARVMGEGNPSFPQDPGSDPEITAIAAECHQMSRDHGWWSSDELALAAFAATDATGETGDERSHGKCVNLIAAKLALIHSEVSEALECLRDGEMVTVESSVRSTYGQPGKPEGFPSELADIVIRVFDLAGAMGIDMLTEIRRKIAFNSTRSHRHGGKAL